MLLSSQSLLYRKEVTVSGRKQLVNAVNKVVMKVNISGQTKNFSAVSTLEAWDISGNVLDVHINPSQGQAQYELNLLRKDKSGSYYSTNCGDGS